MSISNSFYNYITFLQSAEFAAAVAGLLLIAGFLIFGRRFKGSKRVEDIMFGYLGVSALIYAVFGVLRCYVLINTQFFYEIGVLSFAYKIVDVAYLFYAFMWVLFIDASLYHSTDGLKRRYSLAVVPYVVIIGLLLINSFLEGYINAGDRGTLNSTGMLMDVFNLSRLL